jgi:putative tryptophan/tyrosine transport system substrate-binding protein
MLPRKWLELPMPLDPLKRREFITLLGGAAALPLGARAQQPERMRRIGVLNSVNADDPDRQTSLKTVLEALARAGWIEGQNLHVEVRWAGGDQSQMSRDAEQLVSLAPDVLVATGTAAIPPLLRATQTIPIVFANVLDPVGAGFVESLAQPGGNVTGFLLFEYDLSAKWLELLKEIAPSITRVAVIRDVEITGGVGQFAVIQSAAPSLRMNVRAISMRNAVEIERAITLFGRAPNGGLILTASALAVVHRELIIALAARYGLPAVYYRRYFVASGGLVSYGFDAEEQFRGCAAYVDRILKGEKASDLPVQAPTKHELVINLKTAKALGLTVPDMLLARADDVIE